MDHGPAGGLARPGIPLRDLTTLRLGGPAASQVEATAEHDVVAEVQAVDAAGVPVLVLGGGSNLVVADEGFDGHVVAVRTRGIEIESSACGGAMVEVAAGESWDAFVARAVAEGWTGLECLAGIPGLVGASPIQNVGAYGQEVADSIASVRTYDREGGALRTFAAAECGFGYRTSRFKAVPNRYAVLSVRFHLTPGTQSAPLRHAELARTLGIEPGGRAPLADARAAVLALRRAKGMVLDPADHDTWSVGSFFMNPVLTRPAYAMLVERVAARLGPGEVPPEFPAADGAVKTSAAWLIERAGFDRGFGAGAVRVSGKHTLALTNRGGGTTAELVALARTIRHGVQSAYGVRLDPEPVLIGVSLD